MTPPLTPCYCDGTWIVLAVCPTCQALNAEAARRRRDALDTGHPSTEAWDALVASFYSDRDDVVADNNERSAT